MAFISRKIIVLLAVVIVITGCKDNNADPSGEEPVEVTDFIEFFSAGKLPFTISDTALTRKEKDTTYIRNSILAQFIPDSVFSVQFGKTTKPKVYPLKRVFSGDQGTYLFAKFIAGEKRVAYILTFNSENKFTGAMPLLVVDASPSTSQVSGVDRKLSIYKTVYRKEPDGSMSEGKEVYVHNPEAGNFMLIMTDALDENSAEFMNPIDTLPRKNKHSADYSKDNMNLVSVRDGRPGRFQFFIHFLKNQGACRGELKGEGLFTSANAGVYRKSGDPCALQFYFTSSSVSIRELEPCGNRRDMKCTFDGSYPKKKMKPKIAPKKIG